MDGKVIAVCYSEDKGTVKTRIESGQLIDNFGLKGDAHAGDWHRQVSLLGKESIEKMKDCLSDEEFTLDFGDFAENITTEGIALHELSIGDKIEIENNILLEVTQIGKECHHDCDIYQKIGDCIMPREGIFVRVLNGGRIQAGDKIKIVKEGE